MSGGLSLSRKQRRIIQCAVLNDGTLDLALPYTLLAIERHDTARGVAFVGLNQILWPNPDR